MPTHLDQTLIYFLLNENSCASNAWNQESKCQTAWLNSLQDFCLWGPAEYGTVGEKERHGVAYCTTDRHGTRLIPDGTITGAHFVQTRDYVQVTGQGDFTNILIPDGDDGGEFDPHGADDLGNPIGGIVYTTANPASNGEPFFVDQWTNFMSYNQFCFRACWGEDAARQCEHIYDVLGCQWNIPANYETDVFESCEGEIAMLQGIYNGSTFRQGDPVTPSAHPAPESSNCQTVNTISHGLLAASAANVPRSSETSASASQTGSGAGATPTPTNSNSNSNSNSNGSGSGSGSGSANTGNNAAANSNQGTGSNGAAGISAPVLAAGAIAFGTIFAFL